MKQFKRGNIQSADGHVRVNPQSDSRQLGQRQLSSFPPGPPWRSSRTKTVRAPLVHQFRWLALLLGVSGLAQAATFTVGQAKVAGGGGAGTGGQFAFRGTAGQADAHAARTVGAFTLSGGLWARPRFAVSNRLPVAGSDLVVRLSDALSAKVPVATLLGNDVDPDGDPLSLTGVADALPAGATVVMIGPWVIYTAPAVEAGAGSFTYTLSDGHGGHSAMGFVTVSVAAAPEPDGAPNPLAVSTSGDDFAVSFLGVPGYRYRVQFSSDLAPPYTWQEFDPPAIYTAPETGAVGVFHHTDPNPPDVLRLYRAVPNP